MFVSLASWGWSNSSYNPLRKTKLHTTDALLALKEGREEGLQYFFDNYYSCLQFFAQKIIHDPLLAEEVVADAFIKLWERRAILSTEGSIKSLLYTTVKNGCIDHLRKVKRMRVNELGLQSINTIEPCVLHSIVETETVQQIVDTLEKLPPKCRQVFQLFYLQGKSYDEIARELNLSPHTVRSQKQRATRLLKAMVTTAVMWFVLHFSG
ncbi:MAG TPA: RNA polymerase sigma-70 factor [Flavisolibacter sp.]|nr:RNA polymerase sigma-70 factor [Flavisolibacter sp.]